MIRPDYSDADYAGCDKTHKSTTGSVLCRKGPHTFAPVSAVSKKQDCISRSTAEAELIAVDVALRTIGIPAMDIWDRIIPPAPIIFHEDNPAAIRIVQTGKNPTILTLHRVHKVSVAWVHECFQSGRFEIMYEETTNMAAELLTKAIPDPENRGARAP